MDVVVGRFELREDTADCKFGCVGFDDNPVIGVEVGEDWSGLESKFKLLKGRFADIGPAKGNIFLGEVSKGSDNFGVGVNESAIKIGKP